MDEANVEWRLTIGIVAYHSKDEKHRLFGRDPIAQIRCAFQHQSSLLQRYTFVARVQTMSRIAHLSLEIVVSSQSRLNI